jgi:hypothetical protein
MWDAGHAEPGVWRWCLWVREQSRRRGSRARSRGDQCGNLVWSLDDERRSEDLVVLQMMRREGLLFVGLWRRGIRVGQYRRRFFLGFLDDDRLG